LGADFVIVLVEVVLASLPCFKPDKLEGTDKNTLQRRKYIGEVFP
jgi:hypothetical protein